MDLLHTAHVPPGDGPFPTVLALHGWGASAHDLVGLAPLIHRGGALVICPEGGVSVPIGPGADGHGWFPMSGGAPPDPMAFEKALTRLREFADQALERYGADRKRVVLLGFSQGGSWPISSSCARPSSSPAWWCSRRGCPRTSSMGSRRRCWTVRCW